MYFTIHSEVMFLLSKLSNHSLGLWLSLPLDSTFLSLTTVYFKTHQQSQSTVIAYTHSLTPNKDLSTDNFQKTFKCPTIPDKPLPALLAMANYKRKKTHVLIFPLTESQRIKKKNFYLILNNETASSL